MKWSKAFSPLTSFFSQLPVAAAQKEKYETQIMLLKAEHEKVVAELRAENVQLRSELEPVKHENKQLHASVTFLQQQLSIRDELERERQRPPNIGEAGW